MSIQGCKQNTQHRLFRVTYSVLWTGPYQMLLIWKVFVPKRRLEKHDLTQKFLIGPIQTGSLCSALYFGIDSRPMYYLSATCTP